MIDRAFKHLDRDFEVPCPSASSGPTALPSYITSNDKMFSITMDVPGVDPANIDVSVVNDVLTLSGSRKTETSSYDFKKSFTLDSSSIDIEKLSADLNNGVLSVSAPKFAKKVEEKVKKIPVIVGEKQANSVSVATQEEGGHTNAGTDESTAAAEDTTETGSTSTEDVINLDTPPEDDKVPCEVASNEENSDEK